MSKPNEEDMDIGGVDMSGSEDGEQATTKSLMGVAQLNGAGDDLEIDSVASRSRFFNSGTLLLVLVFLVSAAGLYLMRVTQGSVSMVSIASDIEAKIEQALAEHANPGALAPNSPLRGDNIDALFEDTDSIIDVFLLDLTRKQVPIEFIKKNPFMLLTLQPTPTAAQGGNGGGPAAVRTDQNRVNDLNTEVAALELQSVVSGHLPMAMINGEFYRIGQRVGSFTVKSIEGRRVILENGGKSFELMMQQ